MFSGRRTNRHKPIRARQAAGRMKIKPNEKRLEKLRADSSVFWEVALTGKADYGRMHLVNRMALKRGKTADVFHSVKKGQIASSANRLLDTAGTPLGALSA